jgi:squalene synthase HpnC
VVTIADAYAACERIARDHYENFPVASWLLPAAMRPHVAAIYAFARAADDFADEGARSPAERIALLDDWDMRLRTTAGVPPASPKPAGRPFGEGGSPQPPVPSPQSDAIFLALGATIRERSLPVDLFEDLLRAFHQDVSTSRYATWPDLMDYCRLSANPVGRLVLRVAGRAGDRLDHASDSLCTALQLTNFWQDLDLDWRKGRLYVPADVRDRFGASEGALDARVLSPAWRSVLAELTARTRLLYNEGRPVCEDLPGRLGYELRLTWLGGVRILDRLEHAGFDVFASRPALGASDIPGLLWQAVAWNLSSPA